jgi:hypothetical protein
MQMIEILLEITPLHNHFCAGFAALFVDIEGEGLLRGAWF